MCREVAQTTGAEGLLRDRTISPGAASEYGVRMPEYGVRMPEYCYRAILLRARSPLLVRLVEGRGDVARPMALAEIFALRHAA